MAANRRPEPDMIAVRCGARTPLREVRICFDKSGTSAPRRNENLSRVRRTDVRAAGAWGAW